MKLIKGRIDPVAAQHFPHGGVRIPSGGYRASEACGVIRESGCTKVRTPLFPMSGLFKGNARFYFWSNITGSNQAQSASGSSVYITYRASMGSGSTPAYPSSRLRTSGTSISGTSGMAYTAISSPIIAPFWQLEIGLIKSLTTSDMQVEYVLASE